MSCKLIAEIGWNFVGDINLAKQMIISAAHSGADYAKFQTWSTKNLKSGPWDKDGRREIYEKSELSTEDHKLLKSTCDENNIKFLTSCFNAADLTMIRELTNEIKIPSTECTNTDLVDMAIEMFDTIYISVGTARESEYMRLASHSQVTLLHCVSSYPCGADNVNLPKLENIKNITPRFGYSGHFQGIWDAIAAISMGATVVEKHFTIDHNLPGRDNKFALLPRDMVKIKEYIELLDKMRIDHGMGYQESEKEARKIYRGRWSK